MSESDRRYYETHREQVREKNRRWREANPEYKRQYQKANAERAREANRRWMAANREKLREAHRRHRETNPESTLASQRRWREANREKARAHAAVTRALRSGRLTRPKNCEACGNEGAIHAHHEDYERQLDVQWLCPSCHKCLHRVPVAA